MVRLLALLAAGALRLCHVGLREELGEEEEERHDVDTVHKGHAGRRLAAASHGHVGCLRDHAAELNHLARGEERLPPDIPRVQGHEIVCVHEGVDKSVENDRQVDVTVVVDVDVQPVEQEDGGVVVDVEERELGPLLARNDEERVHKVEDFGDVEEPEHLGHRGLLTVDEVSTHHRVALAVGDGEGLDGHVGAEHHLRHVIREAHRVEGLGEAALLRPHHGAAEEDEREVGGRDGERRAKVGEGPVLIGATAPKNWRGSEGGTWQRRRDGCWYDSSVGDGCTCTK
mmetsp:Transcript_54755/g.150934  ORF Transcript_54755/g.150934 Transcript_54755/m.150934 type:complete len:285 (+) Transcript_54755:535-1389(+)